ncbi:MAG: hypothetical protein HYY18_03085 [Planctomycetes bacterium]|nr:hypothetical protein [Planctomycetota bacterium]
MRRTLLPLLLCLASLSPADPEDTEVLASRLASEDPAVRQRAEHDLLRQGQAAQAALLNASRSEDPEVAQRAKALLENLVWPDPGPASGGLRLGIRARASYDGKEPVELRARLHNTTDHDLILAGAHTPEPGEYHHLLLRLDGDELHMCYRARLPLPDLPERLTVPAGDWVEFSFHPETWCAQPAHSKCSTVDLAPGKHNLRLSLVLKGEQEGVWKGRADSNEVRFSVGD